MAESEPSLDWLEPSDALDDGEPNLFSLLTWNYRLVETLHGRDEDLRRILEWAESGSKTASARLITGEGGAGKTRLAAAAAAILRDRRWTAGFLPRHRDRFKFKIGQKGLFLVIDYPEEQPDRTKAILKELAERKTAPYPLRVLFVSRRSFAQWEGETTILQGRFGRHEIAAAAPLDVASGLKLIEEATAKFAKLAKRPAPALQSAGAWLEASPMHRLPLYATSAAIHAVLSPKAAFSIGGGELLKNLGQREIDRVRPMSESLGLGRNGLENLLALGVLGDGLNEAAVRKLTESGACEQTGDAVETLALTPWWRNGRLARLEPDAPAAAFLDLALFSIVPQGREGLTKWLSIALHENASSFGNRLARVLYDLHTLRGDVGLHPLDQRLEEMLAQEPTLAVQFADLAEANVPFWGANFATRVALILAEASENPAYAALYYSNASSYLSALGRQEEAFAAAQGAADRYRVLSEAEPEIFASALAGSLTNLANVLSELGHREKAYAAAQEAVELYRSLADATPEIFTPFLATSLNNLANGLSDLGHKQEALAAAREAVELRRELASKRPDAFTPDLATSLNNLATVLSELRLWEDALAAAQEAVKIRRALANARPEAFAPNLAGSLNNLAHSLSKLGRKEEALAAVQEAAHVHRILADARPEAFAPKLAASLNNLAYLLSELGRPEEALAAIQESAHVYRSLADFRPTAFEPDLAMSLNNLANALWRVGMPEQALGAAREATDLYRGLASTEPMAFSPDLAMSLNNLFNILSGLGRKQEALAAAQEAAMLISAYPPNR
ncbi:hypothetical protein C2U70_21705 [Bradyrhizobium guangdongense]|nr:hypothetical protein C2U70_21705 [Bradyrhizobium guangdongense]